MRRHILVVLTNAVQGCDEQYNTWYDETHLADVLQLDGFVAAHRYKLADAQMLGRGPYEYLAIYEIESDDPQQALDALRAAAPGMTISDALDVKNLAVWTFAPLS
jgi:hypothetical protein